MRVRSKPLDSRLINRGLIGCWYVICLDPHARARLSGERLWEAAHEEGLYRTRKSGPLVILCTNLAIAQYKQTNLVPSTDVCVHDMPQPTILLSTSYESISRLTRS